MKTVEELKAQNPIFLNDWAESKIEGLISDFELTNELDGVNVLFASYSYANYSGDAWVLFEKGGNLFEVNGSHCSCYGLEGQWDFEPVVLDELVTRLSKGYFGTGDYSDNGFADELKVFLGIN